MSNYNPYSADMYRDYRNNFLTEEKYAEHTGVTFEKAREILKEGKFSHNLEAAARKIPNAEKIQFIPGLQRKLRIFFDGIHSKVYLISERENEIILREEK